MEDASARDMRYCSWAFITSSLRIPGVGPGSCCDCGARWVNCFLDKSISYLLTFMLSVIRHLIKSLPIETACTANIGLPTSEGSFPFVLLLQDCHLASSARVGISAVRLSSALDPENEGMGPSTLSMATGTHRNLHTLSKHWSCSQQIAI